MAFVADFGDDARVRRVDGNLTCYGGSDGDWHGAIVASCASLRAGFRPSYWVRNSHVQNVLTVMRDDAAPSLKWDMEERLTLPDAGTVSIQWLGLTAPMRTPVLVVLHTITGSGDGLRRLVSSLHERLGWVIAACNRRGHAGLELTAPRINTMGATADLRRQLEAIGRRRRQAPMYGIGVSAGSGLLVRYLGEEAARSRLRAAVALCPAYDIRDAFLYAHRGYDRYLTRRMIRFFLHRNRQVLGSIDGYDHCAEATTMAEFHDRLFPLAGFGSRRAYYLASNPMEVARDVVAPVLVINAADDPVCALRNVHRHLDDLQKLPRMTLAVTRRGGHCGFIEGPGSADSWAYRVVAEYLGAVHRLLEP
ncbi:MAG TPA: alpha/beta fold hydrolase [Candidatus Binatia bacterium]|nr:alpha/beta fold hydrolase [Candidatus Binatia bacterium]